MQKFLSSFIHDHIRTNQLNSILRFSVAFILGIIFIHSYMTRDEVGILEYGLFLAYTGSFVFTYAYSSAILSKVNTEDLASAKSELNQVFWQLVVVGSISMLLVYGGLKLLPLLDIDFLPADLHLVVAFLAGMIIIVIPAELYYILFQRAKAYFFYSICIHGSHFLAVCVALYLEQPIQVILWLYLFVNVAKFMVVLKHIKPTLNISWTSQKGWFILTIPLILHFLLGSTMDYLDGHIVASVFDENQFLYYRYGARELPFSIILHTILYAKKDNAALVWFSAIEFIVNLTLSLILIKSMGISGVALATVFAFLLNRVLTVIYVKKKYEIRLSSYLPIKEYCLYFAGLILSFGFVQYFLFS